MGVAVQQIKAVPKQVESLRQQARMLRQRADQLEEEAFKAQQEFTERAIIRNEDRLLNRTQALELLSITTLESLKTWERKYRSLGYLHFENNKILRSEVLRFIDDLHTGKIARMERGQYV